MNLFKQLFTRRRRMTREQAERVARREFGTATRIEERDREIWQWPRLESIGADLRYALRQLSKSPGFAVTVVLTLSFGKHIKSSPGALRESQT